MKMTDQAQRRFCLPRRMHALLAAMFISILTAASVCAQVVVVDPANVSTNQTGFATQLAKTVEQYKQQILQYTKQLQQYELQLQQYQQMLSSIQNISNGVSLMPNELQRVTNTAALIQGRCSSTAGVSGVVSTLMNSMSSLMTQSITQAQQILCERIVTTQIDKYNQTVDMLNKLHDQYGDQFQQLESLFGSGSSMADTDRASGQVQKYSDALATEMGNWQTRMKADDAVIETLQSQQSILGRVAMKGSSTTLGNVVQATTFAAAFH